MEIDRMLIFECDESMNNSFTFDQIKTCYIDPPTMEPFQLFNLIQFLMYDEDLKVDPAASRKIICTMVTREHTCIAK